MFSVQFPKVIKMIALFRIRVFSLESIADFFETRFYQVKSAVHDLLWKHKLTSVKPPLENDLSSMLDAAERQNELRRILK